MADSVSDASRLVNATLGRDALTERSRRTWSAGDYDRVSEGFREEARAFVERLSLRPGQLVLDAACGSGNLTIPAARTGAIVTGIDLVLPLLSAASRWATREHLPLTLDLGNVEHLPYADERFDVVTSMFGIMFAARPERVVAELARVNAIWRPGGARELDAPRLHREAPGDARSRRSTTAGIPSPLLWSDEPVLRERFDDRMWQLTSTPRTLTFRYPHTPAGTAELFRVAYGPTVRAFAALDEDARAAFATDLAEHWAWHQRGTGSATEVDAEYLEVVAVRR
jgi:SAM-dependent methyltransferase